MTLREELARRLAGMQWRGIGDDGRTVANVEIDAAQGPGTTWGDLADECIRQMEWARRCVSISGPTTIESTELRLGEIVPVTKIIEPARTRLGELTLPPPDWKP